MRLGPVSGLGSAGSAKKAARRQPPEPLHLSLAFEDPRAGPGMWYLSWPYSPKIKVPPVKIRTRRLPGISSGSGMSSSDFTSLAYRVRIWMYSATLSCSTKPSGPIRIEGRTDCTSM